MSVNVTQFVVACVEIPRGVGVSPSRQPASLVEHQSAGQAFSHQQTAHVPTLAGCLRLHEDWTLLKRHQVLALCI